MAQRTLDITVMSAKDLNKVNLITKMDVYVVVSISGSDQKTKTHVDHTGDNNPTWNFPIKFTVDENAAIHNGLNLVFKLRCQRALGDKDIGEVDVPIKELLEPPNSTGSKQFVSYQIRKPSGKPKGQLTFSYQFSDKIAGFDAKIDQPVTAFPAVVTPTPMAGSSCHVYPPPPVSSGPYPPPACGNGGNGSYPPPPAGYPTTAAAGGYGYGYPPPPTAAAYGGYPPQSQYGYPPPPPQQGGYGYGYPPPVQQQPPKKNSKFGLGLGAGLLGGALGGMIIGDAISDAGAYDSGFGDVGGFDF